MQFQEELCWILFVVKTDNTPLTYIVTTPNLDAIWHHWLESVTGFTFSIKHKKGSNNAVADALSCVASKLNAEALAVKSILDGVSRRNSCSIRVPSITTILWLESWRKLWMGAIETWDTQGQRQTLSLLQDQFWWPGMAMQMQKVINGCERCIQ